MKLKSNILITAAVLLLGTGCGSSSSRQARIDGVQFRPADEPRQTQLVLAAQTNAGARDDAMLHSADFDGPRLNALGEDHLDRMLDAASGADPMVV